MIQFNLLPDVKLAYIKAQRARRLVTTISVMASLVAVVLLVLLILSVDVVQKKSLHDLNADINTNAQKLQNTPQLGKVLTVQNQLGALTGLHDKKPAATRLFNYLSQVTPAQVTISNIHVDFTNNTISVTGGANSLTTINTFVDSLKFTTYKAGSDTSAKAFSQVVLSSFGVPSGSSQASYSITLAFDATIFSNANDVTLNVPQTITTRSVIDQPTNLFEKATSSGNGQ